MANTRYEACLGANTNQWWIYDNGSDEYIDPPSIVLKALSLMPSNTADDMDAQVRALEALTSNGNAEWLFDGHRYHGEDLEI